MSTREQTYRLNINENNKKKENNLSHKNNKNLINYWDKKKQKSEAKLDKIRKELYNKEFNEIRKTPRINSNSKKIVKKILLSNDNEKVNVNKNDTEIENLNSNRTNLNNKICLTDYNTIFSNRMNRNYNRPQTLKKGIKKLNFQNKTKPIIKEEKKSNFYGYIRYDPVKVNDVRHKVHNLFDSLSKNDSYQKLYENYINYKNNSLQHPIEQFSEINNNKQVQQLPINPNNEYEKNIQNINDNSKPKMISNDINNNLNINSNIEQNKINDEISNENKYEYNDNFLNNPNLNNVNKPIEVPKIEILNNNDITNEKIKPLIDVKNSNNSSKTLNKRNDDLQKFILFTNNLNFPYNIPKQETNKNKTPYEKPKVQINLNNNLHGEDINLNDYQIQKYIKINENNVYPKTISKDKILSKNFIINDVNKKN